MSYLKFDKNLLINLDQSLTKEMLRTNQAGAYHCTSLVGCNTRKQHGLLVIPVEELGNKPHVLLSSLDESSTARLSIWAYTAIAAVCTVPPVTSIYASSTARGFPA